METNWRQTARFAFRQSLGVLFGYVFLGTAFGILLRQAGFGALWSLAFSGLVYAGSLQFVLAGFLAAPTALPTVALMSLFINARHLFYGLSFIERFRSMGKKRPYMIFSLTDETYSVLCGMDEVPAGVEKNGAMFLVALLDQLYWVAGSLLGTFAGGLPLDFTGIDFSMTALFLVVMTEQWRTSRDHRPALVGLGVSLACLWVFGASDFLIPAMVGITAVLTLLRSRLQEKEVSAHGRD